MAAESRYSYGAPLLSGRGNNTVSAKSYWSSCFNYLMLKDAFDLDLETEISEGKM